MGVAIRAGQSANDWRSPMSLRRGEAEKGGRKQGRGGGGSPLPGHEDQASRAGIAASPRRGRARGTRARRTSPARGRGEEGREGERKGSIPSPLVPSHRALGSRPLGLGPRVVSSGRALRGRRLRVRVRERGLVPKRGLCARRYRRRLLLAHCFLLLLPASPPAPASASPDLHRAFSLEIEKREMAAALLSRGSFRIRTLVSRNLYLFFLFSFFFSFSFFLLPKRRNSHSQLR